MRIDAVDRKILSTLVADGRKTLDEVGTEVGLSASAVKRRIDRLRTSGVLRGFKAVVDYAALDESSTEAFIELFFAPGVTLEAVTAALERHPEVIEAWSITGDPDAIARVRTRNNADLERLIRELQHDGKVVRTRSQVVLSPLIME